MTEYTSWDKYVREQLALKKKHARPHKMRFRIRDGWSEWKEYATFDEAYLAAERRNDGSLSWDDFEIVENEKN